jgi:hypothetical protein
LSASGGLLAMKWGTTRATIKVEVTPTLEVTMPESEAQPSLGRYEYRLTKPAPGAAVVSAFIVTYENRTLKVRWEQNGDYFETFALIRVAPGIFTPGIYDDHGTLYEVLRPDMMFMFRRVAGQPVTCTVRLDDDTLEATATRKP